MEEGEIEMIGEQFLDSNGKWITSFNTEGEYEEQMRKVRKAIRLTLSGEDFDVLDGYLQSLRHSYYNLLKQKELIEFVEESKDSAEKESIQKCIACGGNTNDEKLKVCDKCASEYKF